MIISNSLLFQKHKNSLIMLLVFTILHLPLLFLGPVNLEFAFGDLIKFFQNGNTLYFEQFTFYQANTIGLSFLGWLVSFFNFGINEILTIRILNLFGAIIFVLSFLKIANYFKIKNIFFINLFIMISPIFWTFSTRSTADMLPAALIMLSYSLFLSSKDDIHKTIIAALLFGLSLILKPLLIFMYIFFICLYFVDKQDFNLIKLLLFFLLSFLILFIFISLVYLNFDYVITSVKFISIHLKTSLSLFFNNFVLYTGFITLALSPFIFLGNFTKFIFKYFLWFVLGYIVIFFLGYTYIYDTGEMNFSFLENIIPKSIFNGILLITTIIFFSSFYLNRPFHKNNVINRYFFICILFSLIFLSLMRPSQRYILILLPFCFFLLPKINFKNKRILYSTAVLILFVDLFISVNQYLKASVSKDMLDQISKYELIKITDPGVINGSYGNYFFIYKDLQKEYIVVDYIDENSILSSSKKILFLKYNYSLIKSQ